MQAGPKSITARIPECIMKRKKLSISCMRGVFDTDGCFTLKKSGKYPVITFAMKSNALLVQLGKILDSLEIRWCVCFDVPYYDWRTRKAYTKSYLSINGKENVEKWFGIVGTSNPKHAKKYERYKKGIAGGGFEPPVPGL